MAIEFNCPSCGAAIRVPDAAAGAKGSCPTCQTKLLVPQIAPQPPATPPTPQPFTTAPAPQDPNPINQAGFANPPITEPPVSQPPMQGTVDAAPFQQFPTTQQPAQPAFPQVDVTASPVQFPGPPVASQPGFPTTTSVASQVRRRAKGKKSGLWFPVLCGVALVGGLAWLYIQQMPDLNGERVAFFIRNEALDPKTIDKSLVDVSDDVKTNVLNHFAENRERLKSQLVETQFSANAAGLEVQILTGSKTRFARFPIDEDLRSWYNDNYDMLESPRSKSVRAALKDFFKDWDVAARNQQGVEDFASYRDSVGLASSVDGLGFNVCAMVDLKLYPCVYEDDGFLYFLLPPSTRAFKVVGARVDGKKSYFPGEYNVTIKASKK